MIVDKPMPRSSHAAKHCDETGHHWDRGRSRAIIARPLPVLQENQQESEGRDGQAF